MVITTVRSVAITHNPASFLRIRKLTTKPRRASVRTMSMSFFGKFFGGNKSPESKGENDDILAWARNARPGTQVAPPQAPEGQEIATFAGGCFWGIELAFQRVPGVTETAVGYTQGNKPSPTYEEVCSGSTGHTEGIQMYYNPSEVTYRDLIEVLLERTDPTTLNRQGNDRGTQYRSGIYYHNEEQKKMAETVMEEVTSQLNSGTYPRRTDGKTWQMEIKPASEFWLAESYHQQYLSKGGRFGAAQSAAKGCKDKIRCYG